MISRGHFSRVSGTGEDHGDEVVWVESDGGHHLFKTIRSQGRRGLVGSNRALRWVGVRLLLWISLLRISLLTVSLLAVHGLLILRLTILLLILWLSILLRVLCLLAVVLLARGILARRGAGIVGWPVRNRRRLLRRHGHSGKRNPEECQCNGDA